MSQRTGQYGYALVHVPIVLWVAVVTLMLWNLDPKFGGPYGWSVFIRVEFWILAILPSLHYAALVYAFRFRWRKLSDGDLTYQHLAALAGPIVLIIAGAILYKFRVHDDVTYMMQSGLKDFGVGRGWANMLLYLTPLYLALFFLICSVSGRAWTVVAAFVIVLGALSVVLTGTLTYTEVSQVENGQLHARITPDWVRYLSATVGHTMVGLNLAAIVYTIVFIIFWSLSWTLPVHRRLHHQPAQEEA